MFTWEKSYFRGQRPGKYDYFEGEQIFISPLCKGRECCIPPRLRFDEFCQMKYFGRLCLQNYYFGTSLYRAKSWRISNKENTILLRGKYDVSINVTWDCFDQSNFYISWRNILEWNNIICCGNKIIYWGNKIICCGKKISFLWEQINKFWE